MNALRLMSPNLPAAFLAAGSVVGYAERTWVIAGLVGYRAFIESIDGGVKVRTEVDVDQLTRPPGTNERAGLS